MNFLFGTEVVLTLNTEYTLQDIVIKRLIGRENCVQGPLLLKLLFFGLKNKVSIYSLKGQCCKE